MLLRQFTVYDEKAQAYMQPFFEKTLGSAIRAFTDACNNPQTSFFKHPADFTLFHLGDWDDSTAETISLPTPRSLGTALEHKTQQDLFPFSHEKAAE